MIVPVVGVMVKAEAGESITTKECMKSAIQMPDLVRWLSKSSALCTHFQRLANIATSTLLMATDARY